MEGGRNVGGEQMEKVKVEEGLNAKGRKYKRTKQRQLRQKEILKDRKWRRKELGEERNGRER